MKTTVFCCLFFAFIGFTAVAQTPKTANKTTKQAAKTAFEPKYLRRAAEKYKTMMPFDKTNTAEVNAWAAMDRWLETPSDTLEKMEKTYAYLYEATKAAAESLEPNADSLMLALMLQSHEAELPEFVYGEFAEILLDYKYPRLYRMTESALQEDSSNASLYFELSYCSLFVGKYTKAIESAQKTLQLNPKLVKVETNLALGYLLNNQYDKAEAVYKKWKGKKFDATDEENANQIFLKDIADLEGAGIQHKDFDKVKRFLTH